MAILALPGLTDGERTWAPFAAGRLSLFGPPSPRAWAWARREAPGRFTLKLADDDGRVFLAVEDLALRPLGPAVTSVETPSAAPLYAPSWTPAPALPPSTRGGPVLLIGLAQAGSLGPALREALSGRDLYTVELGAGSSVSPRQAWAALGSAEAMRQAIGAMVAQSRADSGQTPEELLFLGGVRTTPGLNLQTDLEHGPRALLHVLQAAASHGLHRGLLRVITSDASPVGPAGVQSPAGATLHGLARSAAREFPERALAVIDVAAADLGQGRTTARAVAQAVLAEQGEAQTEVAIRGDQRWVRGLQDVRLPPAPSGPVDGVALLIGGAGGIGVALSRALVAQGWTRLAWIGRRSLDATISASIRAVEALGARVLYRAADAADAPALARAITELSAALGPIRRAEHLGLTLADRSILRMSDAELLEPFRIKGAATLALYEALRGQPVERLTLHSSGQSLVGLPGQANYAAASALQDALGLWLNAQGGPTVRVIGWGYWGQVGAVANPAVARHLAGFGILPMDQDEGLAAAAAISAGPVPHVFALRGTPELLRALGRREQASGLTLPPPAPEPEARLESAALARLDTLAAELTRGALLSADLGEVAPQRARLLNTLRAVSRRAADRPAWQTHADLDALVRERPSLSAWRRLVEASARGLVGVLRGEIRATDLLFPGGSTGLVEGVFANDAVAAACNRRIVAIVLAAAQASGGAPVRILEVGAGTGATARAVLEAVTGVEYLYTDLSERFLRHGRERLAGARANLRFEVFDAAKPAQDQGLAPGSFDLILASNVLHALPRLGDALKNLKRCLRPGGLLVINELVTVRDAVTLTFGLTDGWWLSQDGDRLPDAPLLPISGWRAALSAAGFTVLEALGPAPEQAVIVATHGGEASAPAPQPLPKPSPGHARPDALLWLREVLAEALRVPAEALRPDEGFERYGVDSLVTQELTRRLEQDLGPLPSTLFFEFGTLARLAEHLGPRYAATLGKQSSPAPVAPPAPVAQPAPLARAELDHAVAVIGLSGRYPHAPDLDALWSMLMSGGSGVEDLGPRLGGAAARGGVERAAMLEESDCFDARFFRLPPSEAAQIDPQERLLLEQSWLAFEHAGYAPNALAELNPVGVFVGAMNPGFERAAGEAEGAGSPNTASSSAWSFANRLSYLCDLQGPSLAVDTACSSGLTAVHLAMRSLRRGECRVAVVGAVNLIQTAKHLRRLAEAGMLSARGRCSVFSAEADGFVDAEGVGALVLRPLRDALAAGDTVYGVLLGSAMNSGGHTSGYTVPSPAAQAAVIQAALLDAGVPGEAINAVEAHGTGTRLGDPIEVAGLARALGPAGDRRVALRSLKANFGHMESAAGLAGLTRLVLELQHQTLTPSPHARPLNPKLGLEGTPLVVPDAPAPWPAPRLAGVSSFGAGGTNVHVVLGEAPPPSPRALADREQLILLSAPDDERLRDLAKRTQDWLNAGNSAPAAGLQTRRVESLLGLPEGSLVGLEDLDELRLDLVELHRVRAALAADPPVSSPEAHTLPPLEDVAFTSQLGRVAQTARLAILARDHQQLARGLADFFDGRPSLVGRAPPPGQALPEAPRGADLRGLAESWVRGATVDWRPLWTNRAPRRIALPTTRLLRTPCPPPGQALTTAAQPLNTASARRRVAVLGAGPAGLATARCLLEEGFEPVIFERSDQIGGIWAFREGGVGGGYLSTRLQTSKYTSLYSDLAPPEDMDTFPTVPQLNAYLHTYSERHGLGQRTRLRAEVQAVRPSAGGWSVEVAGRPAERFEALAICTGAYWRPHLPQIPGLSRFRGRVLHSQAYHSPEAFAGQRVLVVGNGVSGMDVACDAAPVAARVVWSRRSARLILPRMFGYVPNDCALTPARRLLARRSSAEELIQEWRAAIPEHIQRLEATGLMPRFPLSEPMIHVNDQIVHEVFTGRVVARGAPVEVDESGVRFADGAYDAVDVIVLATGYEPPRFDMLPGLSLDALYDTSLHPDHPNLVVIGHKGASLAVIPTMELEARRWAASLSGRVRLPRPEMMRAALAEQRAAAAQPGHAVFPRFESTLQNIGLAEIVGAWPSPAQDWELFWELLNLPPFPATYRLVGPHAWSGAREWLSAARGRMFVGRGDARLEGLRQELRREVGLD
ncbi:MAG: KR domain-containing protein [Deltaproteobacteria bacterium]|nr:KR domain-containing protein [Deltaproteobacteria bacterium]